MKSLNEELKHPLNSRMLSCPSQSKWTSFQLVDEFGEGRPYAELRYEAVDTEGHTYRGKLDKIGAGKIQNHFAGPIMLILPAGFDGSEKMYAYLCQRPYYPLPITELQVRAEQTRYINKDGSRTKSNPAQAGADFFCQVEVRDLVEHVAHLPPEVERHYPVGQCWARLMREHGKHGVCLPSNRHNVLEVRPLRALRPMLSTDSEFCALNLYQLALMSTLSYQPFGQAPDKAPIKEKTVTFPHKPSIGNWFGDSLAKFDEIWKVDPGQSKAYYPLYEDVPYSKRLEIVPFDPHLYASNRPDLDTNQESPASIHFLDDRGQGVDTDTQAFITHNDELVLIAVRGTNEIIADALRDADALQIPFEEGVGKVHRGFYEAALKVYDFATKYLGKFYTGQKLIICGHSLGGAIALLLSQMLRRQEEYRAAIILYTYGAPRAGDATFTKSADDLVHYRMVNHNDPVPSVPGTWMNTKRGVFAAGAVTTLFNVPVGVSLFSAGISNIRGEPYQHHGKLLHFFPVDLGAGEHSAILWEPGCDTVTEHGACKLTLQQTHGLPERPGLIKQIFQASHHSMVGSYIPNAWATLRRWQEALRTDQTLITDREFDALQETLHRVGRQLSETRRDMIGRPDRYIDAQQRTLDAFRLEEYRVKTSYDRVAQIRFKRASLEDVYGHLGRQPEVLAQNLARWQARGENQIERSLATVPAHLPTDA